LATIHQHYRQAGQTNNGPITNGRPKSEVILAGN